MKNHHLLVAQALILAALVSCTPVEEGVPPVDEEVQPPAAPAPFAAAAPQVTTCSQVMQLADLPFNQAQGALSKIGGTIVGTCFNAIYPNYGFGYLHSSDHYAALKILLEREPTYREVYDSYHAGSKNIDLARVKSGGGDRPSGWDEWTEQQKLYAVLTHVHGIARGSKILDGKLPDSKPEETRALMLKWGMTLPGEPPTPPPTPSPSPTPTPAPSGAATGTLTIKEKSGAVRNFTLTEIPPG